MGILEDGTGSGNKAKVGILKRLHTHALQVSLSTGATLAGDAFNISSKLANLTSANESVLLYLKNNEDDDISITTEFINISQSTGGVGSAQIKFILNPTAGSIITNALLADKDNRRISDSKTLTCDCFRGVEGDTITSQDSEIPIPTNAGTRNAIPSEYIIPKGSAFALSVTPPTGNTSMDVQVGFLVIKKYSTYVVD